MLGDGVEAEDHAPAASEQKLLRWGVVSTAACDSSMWRLMQEIGNSKGQIQTSREKRKATFPLS